MQLKHVVVDGLFGLFNHRIDLKDSHITIIHGPNGYGKTVMLRMIEGLLTGNYSALRSVPFDRFETVFDDGTRITIRKAPKDSAESTVVVGTRPPSFRPRARRLPSPRPLECEYVAPGEKPAVFRLGAFDLVAGELSLEALRVLDSHIPAPYSFDEDVGYWYNHETSEFYATEEIVRIFRDHITRTAPEILFELKEGPLARLRERIHVRFIRTQRLETIEVSPSQRRRASHQQPDAQQRVPTVNAYSQQLASRIQALLATYGARSQELDRTFPKRVWEQVQQPSLSTQDLEQSFKDLEKKRAQLIQLGFLDEEQQELSQPPTEAMTTMPGVLSVYVEDVAKKFQVFDEMSKKVGLLVQIVNQRFQHKKLQIRRDHGFVFTSTAPSGANIRPSDLSSGEQHELIMLFDLLLNSDQTWLVLIDEPEISLHVGWQKRFLDDLSEVVKLSDMNIVIATHSPTVIGRHWNLTVELGGPEKVVE